MLPLLPAACPKARCPSFVVPLMDICRLATPLVRRPRSEASQFALQWGRLLEDALFHGSVPAWSDFSCSSSGLPVVAAASSLTRPLKLILFARMAAWPTQKEELWKAVVDRSRRGPEPEAKSKPGPPRAGCGGGASRGRR